MGQFYLPSNSYSHNYLFYFHLGQHFIVLFVLCSTHWRPLYAFLLLQIFLRAFSYRLYLVYTVGIDICPSLYQSDILGVTVLLVVWYFACIILHAVLSGYWFPNWYYAYVWAIYTQVSQAFKLGLCVPGWHDVYILGLFIPCLCLSRDTSFSIVPVQYSNVYALRVLFICYASLCESLWSHTHLFWRKEEEQVEVDWLPTAGKKKIVVI